MIIRVSAILLFALLVVVHSPLVSASAPGLSEPDSIRVADSLTSIPTAPRLDTVVHPDLDSLMPAYQPPPPTSATKTPRLSPFDTLTIYFASPRLNQREYVARSYHFDAGDYFRFDPSFVTMDYLITPIRKTVKPYGLTGNHLGVMANDMPLQPFDHPVEPDGLIDFSDIPTSTDNDIYLLPGALGSLFGSRHNVATIFTRPIRPLPREANSAFIVDKGTYGISYARSRYSRAFSNGREIDMGIGYRLGNFYGTNTDDDSYAYDGEFLFPVGERHAIKAAGHLYKRNGILPIANPGLISLTKRDRFDRTARVLLESYGADGTSLTSFGYTYLRQGSNLGPNSAGALYKGRFGITDHGIVASKQWLAENSVVGITGSAVHDEYNNGRDNYVRYSGEGSFSWAQIRSVGQIAVTAGARTAERFGLLPNASLIWKRDTERSFWLLTVGYSEREPSLHELHLPTRYATIYSTGLPDYMEHGNGDLRRERQLVGSVRADLGKVDNDISLSAVGGKFWNGIDWQSTYDIPSNTMAFSPVNDDITFVTPALNANVRLGQLLHFHGGASYHYLDYASDRAKTYQPDYQAFGGAELHLYWKQKLIHLYAYGELVYLGPYNGYRETGLGQTAVINTKMSFSMGNFRFHLAYENLMSMSYEEREFMVMPGRTLFWGFVWNFFD